MKREYIFILLLVVQSSRCMELGSISQGRDSKRISQGMYRLPVDSSSGSDPEEGRLPPLGQPRSRRSAKITYKGPSQWCKRIGYSAFLFTTWVLILTIWHFGTEANDNLTGLRRELQMDRVEGDEVIKRFDIVQDTCDAAKRTCDICVTEVGQVRSCVGSIPDDVLSKLREYGVAGQQAYDVLSDIKSIVTYRK